jgi:hypothetical protein
MRESNLIFGLSGLAPESARNCTQELYPVPNGEFKKSINGDLLFLASADRRKYKSIISCSDVNTPIMDEIWIGSQVNVGCIQPLWQTIAPSKTEIHLIRPCVADSVHVMDYVGKFVRFTISDNVVQLTKTYTERIFVSFRPWLVMQVIDFSMETKEWDMKSNWRIVLEEI